jgi:hypothetical protein
LNRRLRPWHGLMNRCQPAPEVSGEWSQGNQSSDTFKALLTITTEATYK